MNHLANSNPKVSILCLTYNQVLYVGQMLDSILMQKTDFYFEVLIHDDASSDGTVEIIKKYQKKYPKLIKAIFQKKNQYSRGIRNICLKYLIPEAKGRYLALCEGDDYWTDPLKLQKQVDFLEANQNFSVCFHPVKVVFESGEEDDSIFPDRSNDFKVSNLLASNFIQTNSVMYRRQNYDNINLSVMPGDWYLHLYHASFGKIGFINDVMSVYRRHKGGIWWKTAKNGDSTEIWKTHGIGHINLYLELLNLYGHNDKYRAIIDDHIYKTISILVDIDLNHGTKLLEDDRNINDKNKQLNKSLFRSINYSNSRINFYDQELAKVSSALKDTSQRNIDLEKEYNTVVKQKNDIIQSRTYKVGLAITYPIRKLNIFIKGNHK